MASFITTATFADGEVITINGSSEEPRKTTFDDGGIGVQLRRARTEESRFNWFGRTIKEVVVVNAIIYDDIDMQCMRWFIENRIKIDLSKSHVAPDALDGLEACCERLKSRKISVVKGSSIHLPMMQGYSGIARASRARACCKEIGFEVHGNFAYPD